MFSYLDHVRPLVGALALVVVTASSLSAQIPADDAPTLLHCAAGSAAPPDRRPVGPQGGRLAHAAGHGLEIPAQALEADQSFILSELGGDTVGVRLDTDAEEIAFQRPAALTLSYRRCPANTRGDSLIIVRVESEGVLTPLPSTHDARNRSVTALLEGNSEYALAVPRSRR